MPEKIETMQIGNNKRMPNTAIKIPQVKNLCCHSLLIFSSFVALITALSKDKLVSNIAKNITINNAKKPELKQILSLKARITNIHELRAGESVSYGHTYTAYESTRIATIPIGYADGVSRLLSNKIEAVINGEIVRQVGNITMDQMMFDLADTDAQIGDVVTLLDEKSLSLDTWAKLLGTINYELTCRLKVRLPRIYTR